MKRILSVCLSVLFLLTALPMGAATVTAEVDLEEVFQSNLNFLDQYYTLNPEFMISKMCGVLYPWSEAEANNFADKPMPAAEFEEVLYRYFAPSEEQLLGIRNYTRYDYTTDSQTTFYNPETGMYNLFVVGGFGGSMPERQYQRYLQTEDGYTVFYAHITYDYLPDSPELWAELEALNWPETFTYEGKEYENGPDGYTCIVSVDDYGNKYEVQYNDGILRILSQTSYVLTSGDADGDGVASTQDVALFQQYLNGWDNGADAFACDVNGDDACDNKDLALLVRYLNGWDVTLK